MYECFVLAWVTQTSHIFYFDASNEFWGWGLGWTMQNNFEVHRTLMRIRLKLLRFWEKKVVVPRLNVKDKRFDVDLSENIDKLAENLWNSIVEGKLWMTRETVKLHWLLQSLSKNFVEFYFYCKILIFWKSFLDFNNVSYWWISWLSRLKTRDQVLIYFCNNFSSQDKCWSISAEVINSKYLTRSSGKTFLKRAWRASVLQICNFNLTIFLITPQSTAEEGAVGLLQGFDGEFLWP